MSAPLTPAALAEIVSRDRRSWNNPDDGVRDRRALLELARELVMANRGGVSARNILAILDGQAPEPQPCTFQCLHVAAPGGGTCLLPRGHAGDHQGAGFVAQGER